MKKSQGAALFEFLVALFLFSILSLEVSSLQITQIKLIYQSLYSSIADQLIQNLLFQLLMEPNADKAELVAAWNKENVNILPDGHGELTGHYPLYKITVMWGRTEKPNCDPLSTEKKCIYRIINLQKTVRDLT